MKLWVKTIHGQEQIITLYRYFFECLCDEVIKTHTSCEGIFEKSERQNKESHKFMLRMFATLCEILVKKKWLTVEDLSRITGRPCDDKISLLEK